MLLRTHTRQSTTRRTGLALQKKANSDSARADGTNRKGEKVNDEEIERLARKAGLLECIDDAYLARGDWLPEAGEFVSLLQSAERERCAKYLRDAAERLAPEGKRINQIDRHVAHVLACKGDELAAGYAWRDSVEGEKK